MNFMENNKQQTAVEWLVNELSKYDIHSYTSLIEWNVLKELATKAKEMEKEQIVHAHLTGLIHPLEMEATKQACQYYNETYGQ